ncbi:MAG: leucine-rich repeat protein [Oscillospiraceae bacterium]|nr:leucine-rich repeat protein [Oscillospiraceae bacterium]
MRKSKTTLLPRLTAMLLAALLLFGLLPAAALATGTVASGTCGGEGDGTNLTWTLDDAGKLTISGTGAMKEFSHYVGSPWYPYRSSITEAVIESGVTSIGSFAFRDCSSLVSVTIPLGVTGVGDESFYRCSSLESVTIPVSVTVIRCYAFRDCESLESVTIPASVTEIQDAAFWGCIKLKNVAMEGVRSYGDSAFFGCTALESVTLSNKLRFVWASTFDRCSSLTDVYFLGTAEEWQQIEIEPYNDPLLNAAIHYVDPAGPTIPGIIASGDCGNDLTWTLDEDGLLTISGNGEIWNYDGICAGFYDYTPWYWYRDQISALLITSGVTSIGNRTFSDCRLTSVTIPKSVTRIGVNAFGSLTNVYYGGTRAQWEDIAIDSSNSGLLNAYIHYAPVTITQQPADAAAPLGELASTTVVAEGEGLTYQWYFRNADAEKWSKSVYKGDTYTLNMKGERNGREVYCVVTDDEGRTVTTRTATLSVVLPADYVYPVITQDAANCFVEPGKMPSVTVAATGYGELSYQWYYCNADSVTWIKSSIKTDTYACAMNLSRHGRQIYCVVSDAYGFKATSQTVTIGYAYPNGYVKPSITAQSGDVTVGPGEQAVATVAAAGDGDLSYQWYYRNAGKEKWSESIYTGDTYTLSMRADRDGRQVYCVVTDRYGAKAESEPVTLHMNVTAGYTGPTILTEPANASALEGQTAVTTVAADGEGDLTYQWYFRNAGAKKWSKSIYTGDTYSLIMTAERDGRQVYCVVTDRYGYTVTSATATLSIAY